MDLKQYKIVIGDDTYLAVPDEGFFECKMCALYDRCRNCSGMPCELFSCGIFSGEVHFVKKSDKKAYISLPISNRSCKEIGLNLDKGIKCLRKEGYQVVTPYDASPNANASYAEHMGKDIQALLECDVVLMMPGWEQSQGCQCEKATAEIYGKEIIYYVDIE